MHQGEKVYELFTKRNLLALSMIYNEIEKIEDKKIQDLMKFTFTSALGQASKLVFVIEKRGRQTGKIKEVKEVGGWATRGFWIPPKHFEINAWNCFEERINKIMRGKQDSNSQIKFFKEAGNFEDLNDNANIIFTDPPYGDAVPYLELDYMWSSWLKFNPRFEDEIIVSDSPARDKPPDIYERMLKAAFVQIYRVLKPGKYMTVTFHNTDIKYWNSILSACILAGFDLEKILYQYPPRPSAKGLLAPYGSAVGDYYIRFRKPETEKVNHLEGYDEERYKRIVLQEATRILADRGEPTAYTHILNGIIVELKREGALLLGKQNPDDVMREHLGKEFILVDVKDEKGKKIGQKWWFKDPASVQLLDIVPLHDRVEMTVVDVLNRKVKVSFDDILQEIFIKFPNAMTPDTQDIKQILSEYANQTKDGNWMLKHIVKERISQHSKMIYYIANLGQKAGYDVWIGLNEQSQSYNKERLSELVTNKEPVWRFIPSRYNIKRIEEIDVIWHDGGKIKFEIEIENTTAITEAIVRGSNIPQMSVTDIKRIIIIPEEREKLLFRKMKDPILNENINKYGWKFLFYKDVERFFEKNERKDKITLKEFEEIFKIPKEEREKQNSLKVFL